MKLKRKMAFWYVAAFVGLATGLLAWRADPQAAMAGQVSASLLSRGGSTSGGLITHVLDLEGRKTRVIVIDPQTQVIGVYDLGQENGEIQLKSIRRVRADLQMIEFNSGEPSPEDIQNRLDQR